MPGVKTTDLVIPPDIEDIYINLDSRETPFLSALARGPKVTSLDPFSWTVGSYPDERDNVLVSGVPEGEDVKNWEGDSQRKLYGRVQKFRRTPKVTDETNEVVDAIGSLGKMMTQITIKTLLQKRNMEKRLLSDADSKEEDGSVGREFMGPGRFFNDAVSVGSAGSALTFGDSITAVPADLRTPTAQIYVGNLRSYKSSTDEYKLIFDKKALNAMLLAKHDATGLTRQLRAFVDAELKAHLVTLFSFERTQVGYTAIGRQDYPGLDSGVGLLTGVDMVRTDYGPMSIDLVQFMPRTSTGALSGRGYIFDMTEMALRPSGIWLRATQLENQGGGPRAYIDTIAGPRWGHPKSACKIDPNVIQGTFS